jgi:hypothetical protein
MQSLVNAISCFMWSNYKHLIYRRSLNYVVHVEISLWMQERKKGTWFRNTYVKQDISTKKYTCCCCCCCCCCCLNEEESLLNFDDGTYVATLRTFVMQKIFWAKVVWMKFLTLNSFFYRQCQKNVQGLF